MGGAHLAAFSFGGALSFLSSLSERPSSFEMERMSIGTTASFLPFFLIGVAFLPFGAAAFGAAFGATFATCTRRVRAEPA